MRLVPRALLAGGVGFAVSFLAACGGGAGLLSSGDSSNLNSQLDAVSSAVGAGHCGSASGAVAAFSRSVGNLPATVDPRLRQNLLQGASTVGVLAQHDCTTTTKPKSTTTNPTTTTSSTTTSSSSTQTSTNTSTTTPSSSTTPATSTSSTGTSSTSGGAGLGGGGGNGGGNGKGG